MSQAPKHTAPVTERASFANVSTREDPQQTQVWTHPQSRKMEDQQTREEQLLSLLYTSEYLSTIKRVKFALSEA